MYNIGKSVYNIGKSVYNIGGNKNLIMEGGHNGC